MTTSLKSGARTFHLSQDKEGHREYRITHLVVSDDGTDGPLDVLDTPGLPVAGAVWTFGNVPDLWATCWPNADVKIHDEREGDWPTVWRVDQTFSTRPLERCQEERVENPLLIPPKISVNFVRYTVEGTVDRFGGAIRNSAFEPVRGPKNEWDANRPQIVIEVNEGDLDLDLLRLYVDRVNSEPMWGFEPRCIKLSSVTVERKYYGTCFSYFTIRYTFDVDPKTFDREFDDQGTMVLNGRWDRTTGNYQLLDINGFQPDFGNPNHYIRYRDREGNYAQVQLNGEGLPANAVVEITHPHVVVGVQKVQVVSLWITGPGNAAQAVSGYSFGVTIHIPAQNILRTYTYTSTDLDTAATAALALKNVIAADASLATHLTVAMRDDTEILLSGKTTSISFAVAANCIPPLEDTPDNYSNPLYRIVRANIQSAINQPTVSTTITDAITTTQGTYWVQFYNEANFFFLNLPANIP